VNQAGDRAAVLSALDCVDAVEIFDEDTPEKILHRLRPDVWVKGGDYTIEELPEAAVVAGWGGRTVVLPYLPGHSTTDILSRWA
jgi:rfaE bifunctional protein nucleotidyltransferase chain/domain